ncbi:MAG TPA: DinB family protein [Candidatus Limnocylindrales bacterium]
MTDVARFVSQPEGWQPNEYQRTLLGRLGESDPAQVQAATPAEIRALIAETGDDLRTRPADGEWSVFQCIGHICDAELVIAGRYRWILAHDQPQIVAYDQDLWANRFHGRQDEDFELLLSTFEALRRADIDLWKRTPASDRARSGVHLERGPESYELTFRLTAGHDLVHMDQARQALAQVRAR